jgi:hypothetical protein
MTPSVVVGDVSAILGLGLRDALQRSGITVVADLAQADAALIDLDASGCRRRAARLTRRRPGITVIACSTVRPAMVVFAGDVAPAERPLTAQALQAIVQAAAARSRAGRRSPTGRPVGG